MPNRGDLIELKMHFKSLAMAVAFHGRLSRAIEEFTGGKVVPILDALIGPNGECSSETADDLAKTLFEWAFGGAEQCGPVTGHIRHMMELGARELSHKATAQAAEPPAETWRDRKPLF